jgi:hypothetical protein
MRRWRHLGEVWVSNKIALKLKRMASAAIDRNPLPLIPPPCHCEQSEAISFFLLYLTPCVPLSYLPKGKY